MQRLIQSILKSLALLGRQHKKETLRADRYNTSALKFTRLVLKSELLSIDRDGVLSRQAFDLKMLFLKIEDDERVLPRHLVQVAEVDVDLPDDFDSKLAFLLGRRPANNAVQLGQEEAPVPALEQSESRVVKGLNLLDWRLYLKLDLKFIFPLFEPTIIQRESTKL
jgi:hypothetical protein